MADPDFTLLPADDEGFTDAEDLDAAAQAALEDPTGVDVPVEPPEPFGRTALFDFRAGRFVRRGGSPVFVTGFAALEQWCMQALYTARFAHAIYSDDFGMEQPEGPVGATDVDEAVSDWTEHLQEALLVHDRISGVEGIEVDYQLDVGAILVSFDVVTDEGALRLEDVPLDTVTG